MAFLLPAAFADDAKKPRDHSDKIELDDLPEPPAEVAKLIKDAKASFHSGRKTLEETLAARERSGLNDWDKRLAAETKLSLKYDFRSKTKWRIREESGKRILLMTVTYTRTNLKYDHEIWFRRQPSIEGFWESRLVRHELDHVRISTNPMVAKTFANNLRKNRILRHELEPGEQVDQAKVQKLVDEHAEEVFQEIVSFVDIRYKELDRVTDHGLEPLPKESKIRGWMK